MAVVSLLGGPKSFVVQSNVSDLAVPVKVNNAQEGFGEGEITEDSAVACKM